MITPPKIPLALLERFCPPQLHESIEGDLVEQFYIDVEKVGVGVARRRFTWNVVRFFRLEILLRNRFTIKLINAIMVGNYFKVAVRNIQKRKLYSFINAFGLSIGIAFCMLIWLFIQDELSFDQFHANKKNIYRIESLSNGAVWSPGAGGEEAKWYRDAWLQMGLLQAVKDECPEVVAGTRFNRSETNVTYGDKLFHENITMVDPDFFRMFSFPLLRGNPESVLNDKYSVVITPAIAEKYFGDEDPIGKTFRFELGGGNNFTVTGIIEAPPANSSFDFAFLLRQENRNRYEVQMTRWGNFNTPAFVQLRADADTAIFRRNLALMCEKYVGTTMEKWRKDANLPSDTKLMEYTFTPLPDIHMKKEVSWHKVSDINYSYILGAIALLILIIGSINYISLALTTSAARRTEVGIRKVVGAVRNQLLYQFGFESLVLSMISLIVGIGLAILFLPSFNQFTSKGISLSDVNWLQFIGVGVALAAVVGIISGSYPSLFLARFKPAAVLKGSYTTRLQAGFTRPLVVLQFGISAFLIVSSVIMYRQMKFIATKDLGFNPNSVLTVPMQTDWNRQAEVNYETFRAELQRIPGIENIAGASYSFNDGYNRYGYKVNDVSHSAYVYAVDPNYIPTLGMTMVSGRNFDPARPADSMALIVNEALVKDMGWTDLDDAYLNWLEDSTSRGYKVIGVVKDYNFQSLESAVEPMLLTMDRNEGGHMTNTMIRFSTSDIPGLLKSVEDTWHRLFPDKPFNYSFVDEAVAKQYVDYEKRMSIVGLSTLFAILISCLGLFGLAGINAINRTREIGIRKVMGADVRSIFILLNRQYIWLSLIAFGLAIPFSWYVMDKWLDGFKFRIPMGWELFAVSVVVGLVVALITVSYHAVRVSLINPAETLKYE